VVEISAHGSPFTLQTILGLCLKNGARMAGPGEFTQRAFLNGKMDLAQAEAVAELIRAKTDKTQAAALGQMQGHLSQRVRDLRAHLLPLLAHIEVGLDHSDEDHDFLQRSQLTTRCEEVRNEIEVLLQSARVSKILREGLHVALIGRPNVGKSSLLNAILKEDRAIVAPTPGTTRDTLQESINVRGIPMVFTDTAGLREETKDPIECLGIKRTRQALEQADVVLAIFDASEPLVKEDKEVMEISSHKPHILVMNKCDLVKANFSFSPRRAGEGGDEGGNVAVEVVPLTLHPLPQRGERTSVHISAKTGEGLGALINALVSFASDDKSRTFEAQWLLNARHQAALDRAREALTHALEAAQAEAFEECVALELQTALGALGEIIGETTTEDLLDQIFSKFCIGK
jgi:tRNA modification GTPase